MDDLLRRRVVVPAGAGPSFDLVTFADPDVDDPDPGDLVVRLVRFGEAVQLHLRGEFDLAGTPAFDAAVDQLDVAGDLVVDVSGLVFVDSTGLERILDLRARVEAAGFALVLCHPARQLVRLLELSGTMALFTVQTVAVSA